MGVLPNSDIARDDYPVTLLAQFVDPANIRNVSREPFAKVDNAVLFRLDQLVDCRGELGWQIIVEEELQAAFLVASFFSNLIAVRTAEGATSNHRATRSTDPSTSTACAKTAVGTPSRLMIGCPNARAGSITT